MPCKLWLAPGWPALVVLNPLLFLSPHVTAAAGHATPHCAAGQSGGWTSLLSERGASRAALTAGHNVVVRAVAQQDAARAYALLEALLAPGSRVAVQQGTFSAVCYALIKAGEPDKADEVLEWRDYLSDAGQEEEQG
ncbi:hypothetical protein QJQ45_000230 [Haematococcus lacustris]|nr:hypothetical protein QJQ45_000230 [Haematococcus lacustris]